MAGGEYAQRRASDLLQELCNQKHMNFEERMSKAETAIIRLSNRPPVWATLAMTAMGTVIGNLIGKVM